MSAALDLDARDAIADAHAPPDEADPDAVAAVAAGLPVADDAARRRIAEHYARALDDYLAQPDEETLARAYQLARDAIAADCGVLELAALHDDALTAALARTGDRAGSVRVALAAQEFLREALSPFQITHLGSREADAALRRLNETLEEQARRIAHALHDEAVQLLASVHIALAEIAADLPPAAHERIHAVQRLLERIEGELRHLSHELRPTILDDLGLLPALQFTAEAVARRAGFRVDVAGTTGGRMPAAVETALYRVVREAIANVARHASATQARVEVAREAGALRCTVSDDGVGFDVEAVLGRRGDRGLGLVGMRERVAALGGTMVIDSAPGKGTTIELTIPVGG